MEVARLFCKMYDTCKAKSEKNCKGCWEAYQQWEKIADKIPNVDVKGKTY